MAETVTKPRRRTCRRCGHKHERASFKPQSRQCLPCRRRYQLRARGDSYALLVNEAFGKFDEQLREAVGPSWVGTLARRLEEATNAA